MHKKITGRMTFNVKASILSEINFGYLKREQAMKIYNLSLEELDCWQEKYKIYGREGLKMKNTRLVA